MWPLGHAAIGYLLYRYSTQARLDDSPAVLPLCFLAVGTQFPDLVDKPLAWVLDIIHSGRGLTHSIVILGLIIIGFFLVARHHRRDEYAIAFGIGALAHALTDATEVLWDPNASAHSLLWPLFSVNFPTVLDHLFNPISELYFVAEFVLAGLAFVYWQRDGYPALEAIRDKFDQHRSQFS
ncbi:metal-dependent hydrolase [Natrinema sp. DC36]|uniref:metal-dependent hydrolase n=1 Tax=Natrinema sp. DC36 TaxID=2878680 RepID=UPI001CEFCDEE|nr:metal-dependent hydrolase [Natrinema sp. DC36]